MVITACINLYRNVHNNRYLLAFCLVYHLECCAMPGHIILAMCQPNILKEYDLLIWFCVWYDNLRYIIAQRENTTSSCYSNSSPSDIFPKKEGVIVSYMVGTMVIPHINSFMIICLFFERLSFVLFVLTFSVTLAFVLAPIGINDVFLLLFILFDSSSKLTFLMTCITLITAFVNFLSKRPSCLITDIY